MRKNRLDIRANFRYFAEKILIKAIVLILYTSAEIFCIAAILSFFKIPSLQNILQPVKDIMYHFHLGVKEYAVICLLMLYILTLVLYNALSGCLVELICNLQNMYDKSKNDKIIDITKIHRRVVIVKRTKTSQGILVEITKDMLQKIINAYNNGILITTEWFEENFKKEIEESRLNNQSSEKTEEVKETTKNETNQKVQTVKVSDEENEEETQKEPNLKKEKAKELWYTIRTIITILFVLNGKLFHSLHELFFYVFIAPMYAKDIKNKNAKQEVSDIADSLTDIVTNEVATSQKENLL